MELKHKLLFIFTLVLFLPCLLFSATSPQRDTIDTEYIPIVPVIEHLGLDFEFHPSTGILTVGNRQGSVSFLTGRKEVFVNGRIEILSKRAYMEEGEVFIPSDGIDKMIRVLLRQKVQWEYKGGHFTVRRIGEPEERSAPDSRGERVQPRRRYEYEIQTIVIDPGHGGRDPGGVGFNGIEEKDIVLNVAEELKRELLKKNRYIKILITREMDEFVSLEERGRIANDTEPDENTIFISIHANASFNKNTSGYETYFLSLDPIDEAARDVASMENSVLSYETDNYSDYLSEIINRIVDVEYRRESMKLAENIQKSLRGTIGSDSTDRGVKSAFFYVLKASKMPGVLIEIGFLTNKDEVLKLVQSDYQKRIARGIAEGINDFILLFRKTEGFTKSF